MLAASALMIVYGIPYYYTGSPKACAGCHRMAPYYRSWAASSHRVAASNCLYCHVRPGAVNLALYRLMFYREIAAQVLGLDLKPWGTTVPGVTSCHRSNCHSLNRLTSTSGDLKIDHRKHVIGAKISCVRCHPGAAHKGVGGRRLLPPRKMCKECHRDKMEDCSYCHSRIVSKAAPDGH